MTDRELLELAANAAGHSLVWGEKYKLGDDTIDCTDMAYIRSGQPDEGDVYWNPLDDDGDALRLAWKLRMNVEHQTTMGGKPAGFNVWPVGRGDCAAVEDGNDPQDLRRAIVRAAAEIGKAMDAR